MLLETLLLVVADSDLKAEGVSTKLDTLFFSADNIDQAILGWKANQIVPFLK